MINFELLKGKKCNSNHLQAKMTFVVHPTYVKFKQLLRLISYFIYWFIFQFQYNSKFRIYRIDRLKFKFLIFFLSLRVVTKMLYHEQHYVKISHLVLSTVKIYEPSRVLNHPFIARLDNIYLSLLQDVNFSSTDFPDMVI